MKEKLSPSKDEIAPSKDKRSAQEKSTQCPRRNNERGKEAIAFRAGGFAESDYFEPKAQVFRIALGGSTTVRYLCKII